MVELFVTLAEQGRRLLSRASEIFEFLSQEVSELPAFKELGIHLMLNDLFGLPPDASILSMVLLSWIYGIVVMNLFKWATDVINVLT